MTKALIRVTTLLICSLSWADQNPDRLAKAQALHERILTIDAHADIEIPRKPSSYVGPDGLSKVAPEKMRAGGVEHIGIGTDFNHGSGIDGYQDAKDALNVTIRLIQRRYSDDDIEKNMGR